MATRPSVARLGDGVILATESVSPRDQRTESQAAKGGLLFWLWLIRPKRTPFLGLRVHDACSAGQLTSNVAKSPGDEAVFEKGPPPSLLGGASPLVRFGGVRDAAARLGIDRVKDVFVESGWG